MKVYQVREIVVGNVIRTPENEDGYTRTIIIKGNVDLAITMYSYDKKKLEVGDLVV